MNENEVSNIFTLERKGQLDRDISVVTAVSVEYLNSLLQNIINERNEASALYAYIGQQNYDLSVNGMLNLSETIRQLYDNNASLKDHMLKNDNELKAYINKLQYYMYNSYDNISNCYDLIGKVQNLINVVNDISCTSYTDQYEFNIKQDISTNITIQDKSSSSTFTIKNFLLSVVSDCTFAKHIVVAGSGELFVYCIDKKNHSTTSEARKIYNSTSFYLPASNTNSIVYYFGSNDKNTKTITITKNYINTFNVVNIGDESIISTETSSHIWQVDLYCNNYAYGRTYGAGQYYNGTKLCLSAVPYVHYEFVKWSDGDTNPIKEITLTNHVIYGAEFKEQDVRTCIVKVSDGLSANTRYINILPEKYKFINYDYYIEMDGKQYKYTDASCEVPLNTQLLFNCVPNTGYYFKNWNYAGPNGMYKRELSSKNSSQLYTITEDCSLQGRVESKFGWKSAVTLETEYQVQTWKRQMLEKGYVIAWERDQSTESPTSPHAINEIAIFRFTRSSGHYGCWIAVQSSSYIKDLSSN